MLLDWCSVDLQEPSEDSTGRRQRDPNRESGLEMAYSKHCG